MNDLPSAIRPQKSLPDKEPVALQFAGMGGKRMSAAVVAVIVAAVAFLPAFREWVGVANSDDLHSHVFLIPLISLYLLITGREKLAGSSASSPGVGGLLILTGGALGAWAMFSPPDWSVVDRVAATMACWILVVWGIGFLFLGTRWMRSALFPMVFLLFMIPLPDPAAKSLEGLLMVASAIVAESVFQLGQVPVFRDGQILQLPGIVLEVAEECSGIRSTWVLFITSILAAHLFLPTTTRGIFLVAAVFPLGVLRNAVRIFVIGWLCVRYGPEMIDHWIHRKGGPLFFGASLVPLFVLAWWLRRGPARGGGNQQP